MWKMRKAEEERKLADLVVGEYADLVRKLEGRARQHSSEGQHVEKHETPLDIYRTGLQGLSAILSESNASSELLHARVAVLEKQLAETEAKFDAEKKTAELDRKLLAKVQDQVVKMRADDMGAARMVAKYMSVSLLPSFNILILFNRQFSQSSTSALQSSLVTLRTRHAATLHTLQLQLDTLQIALSVERRQSKKLQEALDGLSGEIARETYGRRREVGLRLGLLLREASVAEGLQRWVRRAKELSSSSSNPSSDAFEKCIQGAESILRTLSNDVSSDVLDSLGGEGGMARIIVAQEAVRALTEELGKETWRRMDLERMRVEGILGLGVKEKVTSLPGSEETLNDVSDVDVKKSHETSRQPSPQNDASQEHEDTDSDTQIVIASIDILHQPTPRPSQEGTSIAFMEEESPSPITPIDVFSKIPHPVAGASAPLPKNDDHIRALLSQLDAVPQRYETLQRSFRDCHLALKDLKNALSMVGLSPAPNGGSVIDALKVALQRLDEFNEDARMEVEIRITDEELAMRGFTTLLAVPGALSDDVAEREELELKIRAFIDGEDPTMMKSLNAKLEDLQHDLAVLKRALHELTEEENQRPTTPNWSTSWKNVLNRTATPRSTSPAPPTFGTVMTTPRLRHSSSFTRSGGGGRKMSAASQSSQTSRGPSSDPLWHLDLRTVMPSVQPGSPGLGPRQSHMRPEPRQRTLSTMYMIGLGMGSPSKTARQTREVEEEVAETETDGEIQMDVE